MSFSWNDNDNNNDFWRVSSSDTFYDEDSTWDNDPFSDNSNHYGNLGSSIGDHDRGYHKWDSFTDKEDDFESNDFFREGISFFDGKRKNKWKSKKKRFKSRDKDFFGNEDNSFWSGNWNDDGYDSDLEDFDKSENNTIWDDSVFDPSWEEKQKLGFLFQEGDEFFQFGFGKLSRNNMQNRGVFNPFLYFHVYEGIGLNNKETKYEKTVKRILMDRIEKEESKSTFVKVISKAAKRIKIVCEGEIQEVAKNDIPISELMLLRLDRKKIKKRKEKRKKKVKEIFKMLETPPNGIIRSKKKERSL